MFTCDDVEAVARGLGRRIAPRFERTHEREHAKISAQRSGARPGRTRRRIALAERTRDDIDRSARRAALRSRTVNPESQYA